MSCGWNRSQSATAGMERVGAKEWSRSVALKRAQQAAPLRRKSSARFSAGGVAVETGNRGDQGERVRVKDSRRSAAQHRAQHAVPLRRGWLAALRRAQQAAPLQRKSSAGFLAGSIPLVTGPRGDHDNGGFTEQCCRGDCSPSCSAPIPTHIFIATMIGSQDEECKDLCVVKFRSRRARQRSANSAAALPGCRKASPLKTLRSSGRA